MSMIKSDPVLASLNILKTVVFYEEKLGFKRLWCDDNYAIVNRDRISIHFWHTDNPTFPKNTSCYLYVDQVDQLYAEFSRVNVIHPNGKLENKSWGMREFAVLDLDGNLLRIGQEIEVK